MNQKFYDHNDAWDSLVGSQTPEEFLEESNTDDVEKAVDEYLAELPSMFPESAEDFTEEYLLEARDMLITTITTQKCLNDFISNTKKKNNI